MLALAVDRLVLTTLPTKTNAWSSPKRAYIVILLIIVLSIALNVSFIYEVNEVSNKFSTCKVDWGIPNKITKPDNSTYIPLRYQQANKIFSTISAVLFFYIIPACIMIVCNIKVVKSVNSNKILSETNKSRKRRLAETKLIKMILVISIFYLICNLPDIITRVLWKSVSPAIVNKIQPIAHLFLMINMTANFFVYFYFNKHLFHAVSELCGRCGLCPKINTQNSDKTTSMLSKTTSFTGN